MLEIIIPDEEIYNSKTNEFFYVTGGKLVLEHSLISLSKWECKYHKPFLGREGKSQEELLYYIKCMTINPPKDPNIYLVLREEEIKRIVLYIQDTMTAATFNDGLIGASKSSGEFISSETIYYWMISLNIPVEFEKWHLNRLLALIKYVSLKNQPKKKMSKKAAAQQRAALNAARRSKYKTSG